MLHLSVRELQVFAAVARHMSFARAAEELHLSPPAVSMQIARLEATLEVPLFERAGRRISLTTAGEYFLVHARRLLTNLKDAEDTIARLRGVQTGRLVVGVLSTAKYFMITAYRYSQPEAVCNEARNMQLDRRRHSPCAHRERDDL